MSKRDDVPADPLVDPDMMEDPPTEPDAVRAAQQMNDPGGAQPGAAAEPQNEPRDGQIPDPPP